MRVPVAIVALLLFSTPTLAAPPKVAVFDFELMDTSLRGEVYGTNPAEQARLKRVGDQVRDGLRTSGKFEVLDIAPVNAAAHEANLQSCGGCDVQLAAKLGADLSLTGLVQKVSELILNMNIYVHDAHSGKLVARMSADFRGNTDESWSRTASYLLRNRLLAPDYGMSH